MSRPRVAFLSRGVANGVGETLWKSMRAAAEKHDVDLVVLEGGSLGQDGSLIYELVTSQRFDGVLGWASADIVPQLKFYSARFSRIPFVSVSLPVEGFPVIRVDTYQAVRKAMAHLIQDHGHRRIAYIRGAESNNYYRDRYKAYVDALAEAKIPFDPQLVSEPFASVSDQTGVEMIRLLVDERHLVPGKDFTALMGVTESSVVMAARALKGRGFRVPADVAVISADNSASFRAESPRMTAMINPFQQQAELALVSLLCLISGVDIDREQILEARLELNQSCGCLSSSSQLARAGNSALRETKARRGSFPFGRSRTKDLPDFDAGLLEGKQACAEYLGKFAAETGFGFADISPSMDQYIEHCFRAVRSHQLDDLLTATDLFLAECAKAQVPIRFVQDIVSVLRRVMWSVVHDPVEGLPIEDYWGLARVHIAEFSVLVEQGVSVRSETAFSSLRDLLRALSSHFDDAKLFETLTKLLPSVEVPECHVVVYEGPPPYKFLEPPAAHSRLIYSYANGARVSLPPDGILFSTRDILPEGRMPTNRRWDYHINPIVFTGQQIGYLVLYSGPENRDLYGSMANQLANTLQGTQLLRKGAASEHQLQKTLGTVLSKASEVNERSQTIASLIQEISGTMAGLTEDIRHIMAQAVEVMAITDRSVGFAGGTSKTIAELTRQSESIGTITGIISDVAERTRILSINASIEAARAHEAGRGFVTIAHEVKKLAEETGKSTVHINGMIQTIRENTGSAQDGIGKIVTVTNQINELSKAIEAAVARHTESSADIARKLAEATKGSQGISEAISDLTSLGTDQGSRGQ